MKYLIPASLLVPAVVNGLFLVFAQDAIEAIRHAAFMLLAFYLAVEVLKATLAPSEGGQR